MKLKFTLLTTIYISLIISLSLVNNAAFAATKSTQKTTKPAERWFEVEVILFRQLGDKSKLKELFPSSAQLPHYRKNVDLITPYLHPDISALKLQLPNCKQEIPKEGFSFFNTLGVLPELFDIKNLAQINAMPKEWNEELNTDSALQNNNPENSLLVENIELLKEDLDDIDLNNEVSIDDQLDQQTILENTPLTVETLALITLADEAKQYFTSEPQLNLSKLPNFSFTSKHLCQVVTTPLTPFLSEEDKSLQQIFQNNNFSVKKVPSTINNAEWLNSDKPYLISKESLQLGDIVKKLRWSKNFQPLLHLGWRQAPVTRKKSIPMTIMAGENLETHYQEALKDYQAELDKLVTDELFQQQLTNNLVLNPLPIHLVEANKKQLKQQKEQQYIANIFSQLDIQTSDTSDNLTTEELISQLNKPLLSTTNNNGSENISVNNNDKNNIQVLNNPPSAPKLPLQEWFLQGFFKVHLDHYLYITADFSVLNKTLAEQATDSLKSPEPITLKTIGFNQDRRVISGEVHYFDHPYIGMIVQIRRFKRPEPEIEVEELSEIDQP